MNNDSTECYTKLPNSVMAWILGPEHDLTFRQVRVLLTVFRFTYGFNRRSAPLSSRFVSEYTGIDQGDCVRALKSLVDEGFLVASYERKIGFYTLCPRRYKNKQKRCVDYSDDGESPSRWQNTIGDDGDLPSKIQQQRKSAYSPSSLEQQFISSLNTHRVPLGETEYTIGRWRFDFAWPEQRIAVEIDGGEYVHGSHDTTEGRLRDERKDEYAISQGWRVLRVRGSEIGSMVFVDTIIRELSERLCAHGSYTYVEPERKPQLNPWLTGDPVQCRKDIPF